MTEPAPPAGFDVSLSCLRRSQGVSAHLQRRSHQDCPGQSILGGGRARSVGAVPHLQPKWLIGSSCTPVCAPGSDVSEIQIGERPPCVPLLERLRVGCQSRSRTHWLDVWHFREELDGLVLANVPAGEWPDLGTLVMERPCLGSSVSSSGQRNGLGVPRGVSPRVETGEYPIVRVSCGLHDRLSIRLRRLGALRH
jgi:hypothetical protein